MTLALSSTQADFAGELAKQTGLNPLVIAAWIRQEEPAQAENTDPAGHGAYNFLNVGATDTGNFGTSGSEWNNPYTAAQATARWLTGQPAGPGYAGGSAGVQTIIPSKSGGPLAEIKAIQGSGFASSGEPDLPSLYQSALGGLNVTGPLVLPPESGVGKAITTFFLGGGASSPTDIIGSTTGTGGTAVAKKLGATTDPVGTVLAALPKIGVYLLLVLLGIGLVFAAVRDAVPSVPKVVPV